MASFGSLKYAIFDREERKQQYQAHILGLNAYDRHKKFVKDYVSFYGREASSHVKLPVKTDHDTLREGHRFIRSEEDNMDRSWEQRLILVKYIFNLRGGIWVGTEFLCFCVLVVM
ncbi:uncharacterized protein LOC126598947 isoform X3 [Malus sylvestris]|uniref:uncharacterized protein LOC126598947 isoform X3 n=1 Tax=Malus sylvestris TaxID=3752 RepID=UPI0021AC8C9E|nr:uncharacterized protein LOC126598947 isoform X3 [Malus sylvestris]